MPKFMASIFSIYGYWLRPSSGWGRLPFQPFCRLLETCAKNGENGRKP